MIFHIYGYPYGNLHKDIRICLYNDRIRGKDINISLYVDGGYGGVRASRGEGTDPQ